MYIDALEFLEEERDAWAPYEALADLTDEQLARPVVAARGWSGRDLMGHLLAWQGIALEIAKELALNETSPTLARIDADLAARGGDVVDAEIAATWAALPLEEVRECFRTQPGDLRGFLTVVPEARWLKHATHLRPFREDATVHYEKHRPELEAILAAIVG